MFSRLDAQFLLLPVLLIPMALFAEYGQGGEGVLLGAFAGVTMLALAVFIGSQRWWPFLAMLAIVVLVWALTLPADSAAREVPIERWRCQSRIWRVALAMWNYHETHGAFPPAYIADSSGRPIHSWRILILPYLGEPGCKRLYRQYDFSEPWDGPNNRKLLSSCPESYRCRDALPAREPDSPATSYVAVVGPNGALPDPQAMGPVDGRRLANRSNTVMLIEVPAAAEIAWTEPRDLVLGETETDGHWPVQPIVHQRAGTKHPFHYYDLVGTTIAFADSNVNSLPAEALTSDRLPELLAIGGCSDEACDGMNRGKTGERRLRLRWFNCCVGVAWVICSAWLLGVAGQTRWHASRSRSHEEET